jgi:pyruvate ferredoxin oxidoreductase alpha subunit
MLMGIDYRYCKGCLRCVESCPRRAHEEAETPGSPTSCASVVPGTPEIEASMSSDILSSEIAARVLHGSTDPPAAGSVRQKLEFRSGNEAAALAAKHIGFHIMGTSRSRPSTEVARTCRRWAADGEHEILLIAGDGEHRRRRHLLRRAHGGGPRAERDRAPRTALLASSSSPVQAGTARADGAELARGTVSGPARHPRRSTRTSYFALNTGWIILCAPATRRPCYDLNFAAVRIGEHADVRLPGDRHVRRILHRVTRSGRIQVFDDPPSRAAAFLGHAPGLSRRRSTWIIRDVRPYMNDPDLINNKVQLSRAWTRARSVIPRGAGRARGADRALVPDARRYRWTTPSGGVLVNSAAETAKETADELRARAGGRRAVAERARPFPAEEFRQRAASRRGQSPMGDRADSYGADGGNLSLEIRAALQVDDENHTRVVSRDLRLGGKDFYGQDAEHFFALAHRAPRRRPVRTPFAYHGATPASRARTAAGLPPIRGASIARTRTSVDENRAGSESSSSRCGR